MAAERLSMRKVKEALRLYAEGRSRRSIARSLGVGHSTVSEYLRRAKAADLSWSVAAHLSDAEIERRLFPVPIPSHVARPVPHWIEIHRELRRKGVTLQLLWLEYKEAHADGYQYSPWSAAVTSKAAEQSIDEQQDVKLELSSSGADRMAL